MPARMDLSQLSYLLEGKKPLLAALAATVMFIVVIFWRDEGMRPLPGYPLVSVKGKGPKTSWLLEGRRLVEEGARRYKGPFQIMSGTGPKIILANKYADELRNHPALDLNGAFVKDFFTQYHGFEPFLQGTRPDGIIPETVRTKLTQSLNLVTGPLVEETSSSLSDIFGNDNQWRQTMIKDSILTLVSRLSSRVFLGEDLCRDQEWLAIAKKYAVDALTATYILRMVPGPLRPIAYWFIPQCWASRKAVQDARRIIEPVALQRKMMVDEALKAGSKPQKVADALGWMYQISRGREIDYTGVQLQLTLAAVHTTTEVLSQAILDLSERPELVQQLREEAIDVLSKFGWAKTTLYQLRLMDSFLKESQRHTPLVTTAMNRIVNEDVTLSDGTFLSKGVRLNVLTSFHNPDVYENPAAFDARRFLKLREQAGGEHTWQFASTSAEYTLFGHGKHACPGRFFATNEMKVALCHLLLKYDWRLAQSVGRPESQPFETSIGVNALSQVEIRRRTPEIDVDKIDEAELN